MKLLRLLNSKNTLSSIFWFSLLGFLKPAIGIFLLPLYLVKLTPNDYGIIALVSSAVMVIAIVVNLRLDTSVRTYYFDYNDDEKLLWKYLSQVFTIVLGLGLVVFLVFQVLGEALFTIVFESGEVLFKPYGQIALATALLSACNSIYFIYLKNKVMLRLFFIYAISSVLLTIGFQAYFILELDMTIMGYLWGNFIPAALTFVFIVVRNRSLITISFDLKQIKPSLLFGISLIPFSFLYVFEGQLDKWMIERFLSLENVGIYSILVALVGLSKLFLGALDNGLRPFLYQSLKDDNDETKTTIKSFHSIYLYVGLVCLSGVIMVGSNLDFLTDNPKYLEIREYLVLASIASIPLFLLRFLNLIIAFHKKSAALTRAALIKTAFMVVLMLILIPSWGINGAIVAIGLSHLINFMLFYRVVLQVNSPNVDYRPFLLRLGIFCLVLLSLEPLMTSGGRGLFGLLQFLILFPILTMLGRKDILSLASSNKN